MTSETLYRAIGDINDDYIAQAHTSAKPARRALLRWVSVAAALCLLLGGALLSDLLGGSFFGNGDAAVFAAHREDFTPEIDSAILARFDNPAEVKKAYLMLTNEWFLADDLTDFSQAVTTDTVYVVPGGEDPSDTDAAYSLYSVDETGAIHWGCTVYPPENTTLPFGFSGLTYEMIEHSLSDVKHEDYIITFSPTLDIVFIWVRGTTGGDVIIAYPTRPDLLGLRNGGAYTLSEVQSALTDAYHACGASIPEADHSHKSHSDTRHGDHHTDDHHTRSQASGQTGGRRHSAARRFTGSMGCHDQTCTNAAHFHSCDNTCTDPAHYHSCDADCRVEAHNHPNQQGAEHHSGRHLIASIPAQKMPRLRTGHSPLGLL